MLGGGGGGGGCGQCFKKGESKRVKKVWYVSKSVRQRCTAIAAKDGAE